jgi:enoyl-CoA hydratase
MTTIPFEIERVGHVATLWLANPARRNAMGPEFWAELPAHVAQLDADPEVRAVVVAGRGPCFSTGLDLMRMAPELGPALLEGGLAADRRALLAKIHAMRSGLDAIANSDKPFLAAIHGWCIGGGLDLAAACDMRLASADATISLREAKIAIVADMGSLQRLEAVIGRGALRELAFTGKDIDASRALAIGLVNEVLPDADATIEAARAMARAIADNPPLVVQGTKRVLRMTGKLGEEAGLEYVALWNAAHLASEDLREAMTAFATKRPPVYRGR